ncbi:MAG: 50S ribosomal protein L25/general stress protein Ctc [Alphaproteobacteria bacterium]
MAQIFSLPAAKRERTGTGAARALRRQGQIPAIVYGGSEPPLDIAVPLKEITLEHGKPAFFTHLYDLALPEGTVRVLPREVQLHPVTDQPVHVDFLRYVKGARIAVQVAVHFLDQEQCEGLKRGGVLNIVRHEVELLCPVDSIPDSISVSLKGRDIGESIHISAFTLPEGVTPTITDRDFTVATIAAPTVIVEEAAAPAEGEAAAGEAAAPAEAEKKAEE